MSPSDTVANELDRVKQGLDSVDTATTAGGAAAIAIQTRMNNLLSQIGNATDLQTAKNLADRAIQEGSALTTLADALTAMGSDPANPVPIPIPTIPAP